LYRYYLKSKEIYDAGNQYSVYMLQLDKRQLLNGNCKNVEEKGGAMAYTIIIYTNASDP
jgi:hypothetical protein